MATAAVTSAKRSVGFLLGICVVMLGANFIWTSYNSILLPTMVEKVATANRGMIVGLIGFFGTLVGITVSILAGIISDHTASRWGKRTPSILVGTLLTLPLMALLAIFYPPAMPLIVIGFIGMQFLTNVANGAWWPLLVDVVPEEQRGTASGLQGMLTLIGAALGIELVSYLNSSGQTGLALWIIGIVFAATGVVAAWVLRGKDKPAVETQKVSLLTIVKNMFTVRTRVAVFFWVVLSALLANMGMNSLQFFARYFFETYFPTVSPDFGFGLMGGISLIFTMVSAVVSGILSDKIGRRTIILGALYICAVMTILMGFTSDFVLFMVFAAIRSAATGPIVAVVPALASGLAPEDEAGQYMAYNNLSTGLSGALSALVFGVILTTMTKTTFLILYIISAVLFLVGALVFQLKVSQKELDARIKTEAPKP
ncbi:MAG TPA: MFS transporter [Longilinea sp.]|nr:MFS transporter [Longilinea sp.]